MIFDTDIFIWAQRGNEKAAKLMETSEDRFLSIQTYMKLLQCAKNKTQHKYIKDFLSSFGFIVLPLTENIGHRASIPPPGADASILRLTSSLTSRGVS